MTQKTIVIATLAVFGPVTLLADFQYQQTTKMTGGMMSGMMKLAGAFNKQVNEPIVSSMYLKGNREANISQHHGSIIDLDKETITSIDFDKKQYSVMTFEQMKEQMRTAMDQAKARGRDQKVDTTEHPEMTFKASVKDTGQKKEVSGINAREFVLNLMLEGTDKQTGQTGAFAMSNDMWMAPEIRGYQEVRDFQRRMAEKMGSMLGIEGFNPMALGRPDMIKGIAEMAKEMSKLKGIPVQQIMRMGTSVDGKPLPSASESPDAAKVNGPDMKAAAGEAAGNSAASSIENRLGRLGGLAGGLGGLGRKKKQDQAPAADAPPPGPMIFIESTTEMSGFSNAAVDTSKFDVPAGFKQVETGAGRRGR